MRFTSHKPQHQLHICACAAGTGAVLIIFVCLVAHPDGQQLTEPWGGLSHAAEQTAGVKFFQ